MERNQAGLALRRVIDKNLLSINLVERNTGGQGNSKTRLVNLQDALQLVMILPGEMAKAVRVQFSDILKKFFKGDESIVGQVRANAVSGSAISQLARAGDSGSEQVEDNETRRKRIKREDLELVNLEQEIQERRIKNLNGFMELMTRINPTWMQTDTRFRLQTEDMVKNILTPPGSATLSITNGESSQPLSLSISQLAQELGCKRLSHADSCRAGALAAKRYRATHDKAEPPKHRQWVEGAERLVNSYTEADREMLVGVLADLGLLPDSSSVASSHDD